MKKISLLICSLILSGTLMAGIPQAMNFQGVAKRKDGTAIIKKWVYLQVNIDSMIGKGKPYFTEEDSAMTDSFGTFTILIGDGMLLPTSKDSFAQIPWAGPAQIFLQVDFDTNSFQKGFTPHSLGPIQLVSVPYAFAASAVSGIIVGPATNGDVLQYNASINAFAPAPVTPPGVIMAWAGDTAHIPSGWLLCDGRPVPSAIFPGLYGAIGTMWGNTGGAGMFNLPDMRGMFLRGADLGAGRDPDAGSRAALNTGGNMGDNVGSYQADTIKAHGHTFQPSAYYSAQANSISTINGGSGANGSINTTSGGSMADREKTLPFGGTETRPKNVYVNYIIKY